MYNSNIIIVEQINYCTCNKFKCKNVLLLILVLILNLSKKVFSKIGYIVQNKINAPSMTLAIL